MLGSLKKYLILVVGTGFAGHPPFDIMSRYPFLIMKGELPLRQKIVTLIALCFVVLLLAACDMDDYSDDNIPVAYGEGGHCYYVTDPVEVANLQQAGLCPRSWTPMIMPLVWHETYYSYYDSPRYYNSYIPASRRVYYRTVVVRKFETVHRTEITKYSSKAKYKSVVKTTKTKTRTTTKTKTTSSTSRTTRTTSRTTRTSSTRSVRSFRAR
jgi:hypothetical protein